MVTVWFYLPTFGIFWDHLVDFYGKLVGKYTSLMDPYGPENCQY